MDYSIENKFVIVRKKQASLVSKSPEQIISTISGKVTDEKDEPLPGATITLKGTVHAVQSDGTGEFLLPVNSDKPVLIITNVGYEEKEIRPAINIHFNVRLVKVVNKLDEVQIIAYGSVTKRLNTGDVSTVKAETLTEQPVSNPLAALAGRVTGFRYPATVWCSGRCDQCNNQGEK